jgi:hypothetical protein
MPTFTMRLPDEDNEARQATSLPWPSLSPTASRSVRRPASWERQFNAELKARETAMQELSARDVLIGQ